MNQFSHMGQYQREEAELAQKHTVPHAVRPSTKLLTNSRQTGVEVLDQSGLDHFIRERQL